MLWRRESDNTFASTRWEYKRGAGESLGSVSFWPPTWQHSMATEFKSVMRSFFTNTNCETSGNLIYWSSVATWANQEEKQRDTSKEEKNGLKHQNALRKCSQEESWPLLWAVCEGTIPMCQINGNCLVAATFADYWMVCILIVLALQVLEPKQGQSSSSGSSSTCFGSPALGYCNSQGAAVGRNG